MATVHDQPSTAPRAPRRRRGRRGVRPLVLAGGLVLLGVGAGLGPRHLAKEGTSAAAVTGLLLLAVGVVLTGWAAARLLSATRRRWWPLLVPLLLVAAYLSLWTVGQAVAAAYPPRPALGDRTPATLGLTYREVTFASSDGVELAGWYLPSRDGAAVALLHGAGSTRSAVLDHAAVLAEHGYGVLLFDARGHGESAGRGMDLGWWGEADAAGAVDFLLRQPEVSPDRIGLVGLSMGGEQAIGAAGVDDRVAAVVAEGATARVAADKRYLEVYGARGALQQGIDRLTYGLTELLSDAPRPQPLRQAVAAATDRAHPTSFLLVTGGSVPDEQHAAADLQVAGAAVESWTVPDAGHTEGLEVAPTEWEQRVVGFLDRTLRWSALPRR